MRQRKVASFHFKPFSRQQRRVLNWWTDSSPVKNMDGIIADGAIRSGKTVSMALSFVAWSMQSFSGENFAMCGKTIGSFRRNVLSFLKPMLTGRGYGVEDLRGDNLLIIRRGLVENYYYIFGGRDERSQDLIQGLTLAGLFCDEVALMPESFVNQATGRCSVDGSKMWFNCNPAGPMHWFKVRWIDKAAAKNLLYLHFTMDDNLSLSEKVKARYKAMYSGVFFLRYIRGLWAVAEGLIYPMLTDANLYDDDSRPVALYSTAARTISCDYGTTNPCVYLSIWDDGATIWVDDEYRWDSKSEEAQRSACPNKTDAQYVEDMRTFMGPDPARACMIVVDPSAKSFIVALREAGFYVKEGNNEVLDGIRAVATLIGQRKLMIHRHNCPGLLSEMRSYVWDEKAGQMGDEKPVKMLDHGPDGLRYYCKTILPDWRISI